MSKIRVRLLTGEQLSGKIEVELLAVRRMIPGRLMGLGYGADNLP
jgi:hypothetical protein